MLFFYNVIIIKIENWIVNLILCRDYKKNRVVYIEDVYDFNWIKSKVLFNIV